MSSASSQTCVSLATDVQDTIAQYWLPTDQWEEICKTGVKMGLPLFTWYCDDNADEDRRIDKRHADQFTEELHKVRANNNDPAAREHINALLELTARLVSLPTSIGGCIETEPGTPFRTAHPDYW